VTTLNGGGVFEGEDDVSDLGVVDAGVIDTFEVVSEILEADFEVGLVSIVFFPKNPIFGYFWCIFGGFSGGCFQPETFRSF